MKIHKVLLGRVFVIITGMVDLGVRLGYKVRRNRILRILWSTI